MEPDCPCCSGAAYDECCGPLHRGTATASTAVELTGNLAPVEATESVDLDPVIEWRRLQIHHVDRGTENDDAGPVEFAGHYWDTAAHQHGRQRESSRFVRQKQRWFCIEPVN